MKTKNKKVAILCPSIRPDTHERIRENLKNTTEDYEIYFLGEEYPSYATAINAGYKKTQEPYIFTTDDDVEYSEGWLDECFKKMKGKIQVVGTNDLHNPYVLGGVHSTHSLVRRKYLDEVGGTWDGGPGTFMTEYHHNYTDTELVEVATARGVFAPCLESIVEHFHPVWGNRRADHVTWKTRQNTRQDKALFNERRKMWVDKLPPEMQRIQH